MSENIRQGDGERMMDLYWHKAIEDARKFGYFTSFAKQKSESWVSCACGELDERIPRGRSFGDREIKAAPKDNILYHLGSDFMVEVCDNNFDAAESTLAAIEKRAAEILAELPNPLMDKIKGILEEDFNG